MNCYVHNVPGRLRIKIPVVKDRPAKAAAVERLFAGREGIERIRVSPLTGSVVFRYDGEIVSPEQIMHLLRNHRFLPEDTALAPGVPPEPLSSRVSLRLGKAIVGYAVGRALEANGLGVLAALI